MLFFIPTLTRKLFVFSIFLFFTINSSAQPFSWASQISGPNSDAATQMKLDPSGAILSVGYFGDSADFDPGPEVSMLYSNGNLDGFIQKLTPNKELVWAISLGGVSSDNVQGIDFDNDGNIYVTGGYAATVDFDPSDEVVERTALGSNDIYVMKLNSAGEFQWVHTFGNELIDYGINLVVTNENEIVVMGAFSGLVDFDPGAGVEERNAGLGYDVFYLKLNSDGDFEWVRTIGVPSVNDTPAALAVSEEGDIYSTGTFGDSIDVDPGAGEYKLYKVGLGNDIYVQKMNALGDFIWGYGIHGNGSAIARTVEVDSEMNIVVGGSFGFDCAFDPSLPDEMTTSEGSFDAFIQKIDSDGNLLWYQNYGSSEVDEIHGLSFDAEDNIFITGNFSSTVDFDFSDEVFELESAGIRDVFVSKVNKDGDFLSAFSFEGMSYSLAFDVIAPDENTIYVSGYFQDTVDFNPSDENDFLYENEFGAGDVFLVKFSPEVDNSGISETENTLFSVYPNPTKDQLTVHIPVGYESAEISVISQVGEVILIKKVTETHEIINLGDFSHGVYFVRVTLEEGINAQEKVILVD